MQNVTSDQFQQNPKAVQDMATHEPVLIDGEEGKQVIMTYDDYRKLGADKPFVSLSDAIMNNMSPELYQTLSQMNDEELAD